MTYILTPKNFKPVTVWPFPTSLNMNQESKIEKRYTRSGRKYFMVFYNGNIGNSIKDSWPFYGLKSKKFSNRKDAESFLVMLSLGAKDA